MADGTVYSPQVNTGGLEVLEKYYDMLQPFKLGLRIYPRMLA